MKKGTIRRFMLERGMGFRELSEKTNIKISKLIMVDILPVQKIKLTQALAIGKALNISVSEFLWQPFDIPFDIHLTNQMCICNHTVSIMQYIKFDNFPNVDTRLVA